MGINIQFFLRTSSNGQAIIMALCYHKYFNGGVFKYSTGLKIDVKKWDASNQKIYARHDKELNINGKLSILKSEGEAIFNRQWITDRKVITSDWFRSEFDRITGKPVLPGQATELNEVDFFSIWEKIITEAVNAKGEPIKDVSRATKRQTLRKVKAYAIEKRWEPSFLNVNKEFYQSFTEWLKGKGVNATGKHIKEVKALMREAEDRDYPVNQAYKKKSFKVYFDPKDAVYLDEAEINKILALNLKGGHEELRDAFVMACYCGVRHSDWKQIQPKNILSIDGRDYLVITPQKTGTPINIPVHPVVRTILNKYTRGPRILSNQKSNDYLKDIAEAAELGKVSINGSITDKHLHITTHTARRSFATNCYLAGVATHVIMGVTGHKKESSFLRYLKLGEKEKAKLAAQSSFFEIPKMKVA